MNVSGISGAGASFQVGAIASASTTTGASRAGGPGSDQRMQASLGAVSQLFGMATPQLQSALASGQSMMSIAASHGVSSADLVNTISQAITSALPQGAPAPSATMLQKIATNIANHTGSLHGGGRHHHHHGAPAVGGSTPTGLASGTPSAGGTRSFDSYA